MLAKPMVVLLQYINISNQNVIHLKPALFIYFFWPCLVACGILVPRPGIEPRPSAVKAQSPNHRPPENSPVHLKPIQCYV